MSTAMGKAKDTKKMYALSTVFKAMELEIDGKKRTVKSDIGFLKVFDSLGEAQKHQMEDSQILEITVF